MYVILDYHIYTLDTGGSSLTSLCGVKAGPVGSHLSPRRGSYRVLAWDRGRVLVHIDIDALYECICVYDVYIGLYVCMRYKKGST